MTVGQLSGLSAQDVRQRVADGRVNHVVRGTGRSVWQIIRANVFTRVNAILGVLCVIVLSTGSVINAAFGLLIIANSAVGVIQELRAKRTLANLRVVGETQPTVLRDGQRLTVHQSEVVVDDLIALRSGDEIVVDGTLVAVADSGFAVDESQLTGEADPVAKDVGDAVLSGSFVSGGAAVFRAEKVGEEAYAAKLASEASEFSLTDSVLTGGINSILRVITWLLIPTGVLTIWTQLVRSGTGLRESILSMAAAIVPMVPEGLVLMTSIAFAAGVIRLGRYKALVNELVAIEGLARVNTVCTDKTGTLTTNEMELDGIFAADGTLLSDAAGAAGGVRESLARTVASQEDRNATSDAILAAMAEKVEAFEGTEIPFNSRWKYSGVQLTDHAWILGAPDVLLTEGTVAADAARRFSAEGLRVLAFGRVDGTLHAPDGGAGQAPVLTDPVLVTLGQQLRPDARETLDFFHTQDVDLKIISGDNPDSVAAVAKGATDHELTAVDAGDLDDLDDDDFDAAVAEANVFGRVRPEQKQRMVESLQRAGRTVAMTGDGVNDVLALKRADIGVAMGAGAPATRSVAQLVLLTNRFSALPHVVGEGRRVIGNIERVANLFLTKTVYSVVLALVVAVLGMSFPFQPIHVTITGWFTIGLPSFILAMAPNNERPRDGFLGRVLSLAVPSGVLVGGIAVALWIVIYPGGDAPVLEREQAGTAVLLALIVMGLWVLGIVARPLNRWKVLLLVGCVAGYLLIFLVPAFRNLALLEPGDPQLMTIGFCVGAAGAVVIEIVHRAMARWRSGRIGLR